MAIVGKYDRAAVEDTGAYSRVESFVKDYKPLLQDVMREIRVDDIDKRISSALRVLRAGAPARLEYLVVDRARRVVASSAPESIGRPAPWPPALAGALAGADRLEGPSPARRGAPSRLAIAVPVPDPRLGREAIEIKGGIAKPIDPPARCRFFARCPLADDFCRDNDHPPLEDKGDGHMVACYKV